MNDQPQVETPARPILLPRFTLLCGPAGHGQEELAHALCLLDPDNNLAPQDLQEPLRGAATGLTFGGWSLENDLTRPEIRHKPILPGSDYGMTLNDLMVDLDEHLCARLGQEYLVSLWLRQNHDDIDLWPRHIFRDVSRTDEIRAFTAAFDPASLLTIFCGPLGDPNCVPVEGVRLIWLPMVELPKRIETIRKELEAGR